MYNNFFDPRFHQSPPAADFSFPGWEAALEHLAGLAETTTGPLLVVLDEFTYLIRPEPAPVSVLQKMWDLRLSRRPNLRLVLTGSQNIRLDQIERNVGVRLMLRERPNLAEVFLNPSDKFFGIG